MQLHIVSCQWRWRWDLNPRKTCAFTRFRVLRTTVHHRPPVFATSADGMPAVAGERLRTGANEPKTEPRAWRRGPPPTGPRNLPAVSNDCRVNPCTLNLARQGPRGHPPGSHRRPRGQVLAHRRQCAHGTLRPFVDRTDRRIFAPGWRADRRCRGAQITCSALRWRRAAKARIAHLTLRRLHALLPPSS